MVDVSPRADGGVAPTSEPEAEGDSDAGHDTDGHRGWLSRLGAIGWNGDADDELVDRSPARTSAGLAIGMAVIATILLPTPVALVLGVPGTVLVAAGSITGARRSIGYGLFSLAIGIVIAGVSGVDPISLVLSTLLAVLSWDAGRYAITIGEQLGRDAETTRIELAHTALNATVGIAGTGLGYATYLVVSGGQPVLAVILLLSGAVVLLASLR